MAELRTVRSGEYEGAVEVRLGGAVAGHIKHDQAEEYRVVVAALEDAGTAATCRAVIVGGHYEPDERGWRYFGLALLQPKKPEPFDRSRDAFLPPVCGERVRISPDCDALLDGYLNSKAKRKRVERLGLLSRDDDGWRVFIGDDEIGNLELGYYFDDAPIRAAEQNGFPLTCSVRVIREPDRPLRVAVDLPA
jgi:hypothetical protein